MRSIRHSTLLILLLPLGALLIGATVFLTNLTRAASSRLPEVVTSIAAERLNGRLTVGRIDTFANCIRLRDVAVTAKADGGREVISAPEVRVNCSIISLLSGKDKLTDSIESIDIIQPRIFLERRANGRWNVAGLLKPTPKKPLPKWHIRVNVTKSRLIIHDLGAKKFVPTQNIFDDVNASVDTSAIPVLKGRISGKGTTGRLGRFAVDGECDLGRRSMSADLQLSDVNAAYWSQYPLNIGMNILSGCIQAKGRVSKDSKDAPIKYTAQAQIRDAALKFRPIHDAIREVNGSAEIVNGLIALHLDGMVGRSPAKASGYILNPIHPRLMLDVTSRRIDFRDLVGLTAFSSMRRKVVLPTRGTATARIFGRPKALAIAFNLKGPTASYGGFDYRDITADGVYCDRRVTLNHASAVTCGGVMTGSGDVEFSKKPLVELTGRARGLELDQFPMIHGHTVAAESDGDFKLSYGPGGLDLKYRGTLKDGRLATIKFAPGTISAEYFGGNFRINELSAGAYGGRLAACGDINRSGGLRLHVAGSDMNLSAIAREHWKKPTVGHVQFSGDVTGDLKSPSFTGTVEGYRVAGGGMGCDRIAGNVVASRDMVRLSGLTAYLYPGAITLTGTILNPLSSSPKLDLDVVADRLDEDSIAKHLGCVPNTGGYASGHLCVSGELNNPSATGTVRLVNAWYEGIPLDALDARIAYGDKTLDLQNFKMQSGESTLTASGRVCGTDRIAVQFQAAQVPLAKFSHFLKPYATPSGKVDIAGKVEGTVKKPYAEISLACKRPIINGQNFERLNAALTVDGHQAVVHDLNLVDARSAYSIPKLTYDPATRVLQVNAEIHGGDIEKLVLIANSSPYMRQLSVDNERLRQFMENIPSPLSGTINGTASGSISLVRGSAVPDLRASGMVTDLAYGSRSLKSVEVQGSWQHGIIHLQKLEVLDKDMNVYADGSLGPSGAMALEIDAHGVPIDAVRHWVRLPDNFSGRADVTLVASGRTDSPNSEMSFEIVDPIIAGVKFDVLRGRMSTLGSTPGSDQSGAGELRMNDVTLMLGSHAFHASGYLPVDWKTYKIPQDRQMLFESHLDQSSLQLLSAFTGLTADTAPGGAFNGSVKLAGSINSPVLDGELTWHGGTVSFPRIEFPFQNIDAKVTLKGSELTIDRLTGDSGDGGNFSVNGKASLAGMKPTVDLAINTNALGISGHNISNSYGEDVRARFDSSLKVAGDWRTPMVTGAVKIPYGSIALTGKPTRSGAMRMLPVDPSFAVIASMSRDVQLKSGRLRTPLYGDMNIRGSFTKPIVEANLDISGGTISFPMRQLRITSGSSIYIHAAPPMPMTTLVDMRAEGRLPSTSLLGKSKTYTVSMAARGPIDKLDSLFTASPPELSEQDIISLLTGKQQLVEAFNQNGNTDIARVFQTALMPTVFETVGDTVQDIFGIGEFGLETGYNEPVRLTVGNQIANGLYLDYTSVLGARPDFSDNLYEVKLSYRFRHGLQVDIGTGDKKGLITALSGALRY